MRQPTRFAAQASIMQYSVRCTCGTSHPVNASQAGSEIVCTCGQTVVVPPLSVLRTQAGQTAYERPVADVIRHQVKANALPVLGFCACCGFKTDAVAPIDVVCEVPYIKRPPGGWIATFGVAFLFTLLGYLVLMRRRDDAPGKEIGRETVVRTPLCIGPECHAPLRRASQTQLRELLSKVPEYAKLLAEYPDAKIDVP